MGTDDYSVDQAYRFLRARIPFRIRIGIILGSGLGPVRDAFKVEMAFPYNSIPNFPVSTVAGHKGRLLVGKRGSKRALIMDGRIHRYEGYSFEKVTFPIRVMHKFGVRIIIVTNAAGSISDFLKPGDLMLIEDHVDLMWNVVSDLGKAHVMKKPYYSAKLLEVAERVAVSHKLPVKKGVLVAATGPTYETPSEVELARKAGGHAVTMSTIPEVTMCHALGISVVGISLITNIAAWHGGGHEEVIRLARMGAKNLRNLIAGLIDAL
mgnify:CR=1 FL=1